MNKPLPLKLLIFLFLVWNLYSNAQTTLTHNSCEVIKTTDHSCTSTNIYWAKDFILNQFGVSSQDEFIINQGQVGISYSTWLANIQFNIYEIDANFPNSFSSANLIGSSQVQQLPIIGYSYSNDAQIITVDFDTPITIPSNVERILVEVKKGVEYGDALAHIAGTAIDNGISWYRGCSAGSEYINTSSTWPGSDFNFYINISGEKNDINAPFSLNYTNDCNETYNSFHLNNIDNIASVIWSFGDPITGTNNISTLISPTHDFSVTGEYSISATITQSNGSTYTINETISVTEPPIAYPVNDIYACENTLGSGISSSFDTSNIEAQTVSGQTGTIVTYYDQNGNELPSPLPNPFTNSQANSQEVTVRVSNSSNLCCFTETTFNLITNPLPEMVSTSDIYACDNDGDGYTFFDLSSLPVDLLNGQTDLMVELFDSNNSIISATNYSNFINLIVNQDYIKAVITNSITDCSSETIVNLLIPSNPEANQLSILYGCDDNGDGISEYFDISNIENQTLNGQTGMIVTYFTEDGIELPSPLPNPFTNSEPNNQNIIVRVTDTTTNCYEETILQLQSVSQPNINQPNNLYACDQGDGYSEFNTSSIEEQIIGNQTGLTIQYYDSNNNPLPSPLPVLFQNIEPFSQTINIRIEDASNPICYSETSFDLIINSLPEINLDEEYFICNLEPSIYLTIDSNFNSYEWYYEDGTLISSSHNAEITNEGSYNLTVTQVENGIICENSFLFTLIRSVLPEIQQVNYGELGNNFIEIIALGDGNFEYSIDGINYQDNNYFPNIQGGCYTVFVRDKEGCGEDSEVVSVIDYPKFFTPNNDGYNDYWQIKGIKKYPNSNIFIFNRYGQLLKKLSASSLGWDGTYNEKKMFSNDYWFKVDLGNGTVFTGHFSLKR